jgi:hypothetical protein
VGIREKLNENPSITTGATIAIILIALIFIGIQLFGSGNNVGGPRDLYFTTDDSSPDAAKAAMFKADSTNLPPFDHDGKPAYQVMLFSCDGGKTTFIGYLSRYTPEALAQIKAMNSKDPKGPVVPGVMAMPAVMMKEVKAPGPGKWLNQSDPKSRDVMNIHCPDGSQENITPVNPD